MKQATMDTDRAAESSYRRGVSQALDMAANLAQRGCSWRDMAWLADESLKMRVDHKAHPAYIDELLSRLIDRYRSRSQNLKPSIVE